jgi:RimJ/RimL family protein N-acetyltransferase
MEVSFRRLEPADAAIYQVLRLEGLRLASRAFLSTIEEESALTLDTYRTRLANRDNATFGAFSDGALVGIGTILRETRTRIRHRGDIVGMYVGPSARGAGVASGIMNRLVAHARDMGLRAIYLELAADNAPARKLYERSGFRAYGQVPRAQRHGDEWVDTTLMCLLLD